MSDTTKPKRRRVVPKIEKVDGFDYCTNYEKLDLSPCTALVDIRSKVLFIDKTHQAYRRLFNTVFTVVEKNVAFTDGTTRATVYIIAYNDTRPNLGMPVDVSQIALLYPPPNRARFVVKLGAVPESSFVVDAKTEEEATKKARRLWAIEKEPITMSVLKYER